ncbi:ribonuclease III [Brachybacterium halotolerans subsp. kimchii]|uniref:ribonuclease III n=1 Tax=Brachybacterium TaxID=43668 RepID=UPI001E42E83B|nr:MULTISPECIES: ribonuclease III [Brachybacterium]MCG7308510.1 ribonuclease III [Brachybacterium sp. ACRRE]UEJ83018.1 ribonuclease III [Brachybacterium halotolerans subsp. kimchii]
MARSRRSTEARDPQELLATLPLFPDQARRLTESGLLDLALTHRSYSYEHEQIPHNERLEFLGDAVLQLATTEELYTVHPTLPEGDLAKRRAATVNTRALALIGRRIELGQYVKLGRGEDLSGGRDKASILADTMEALIGAVHLSCGQDVSRRYVLELLRPLLESDEILEAGYDFKTRLQEIAAETGTVPVYEITGTGPEHAKTYTATATIAGIVTASGEGASKKDAELAAAQHAVRSLLEARGESVLPRG